MKNKEGAEEGLNNYLSLERGGGEVIREGGSIEDIRYRFTSKHLIKAKDN